MKLMALNLFGIISGYILENQIPNQLLEFMQKLNLKK